MKRVICKKMAAVSASSTNCFVVLSSRKRGTSVTSRGTLSEGPRTQFTGKSEEKFLTCWYVFHKVKNSYFCLLYYTRYV